jgi:hypothetical protein
MRKIAAVAGATELLRPVPGGTAGASRCPRR